MFGILRSGVIFSVFAWVACASTTAGLRSPSAVNSTGDIQIGTDLGANVGQMLEFVKGGDLTAENCGSALKAVFSRAFTIKPAQLDAVALRAGGAKIIEHLFLIRQNLRRRLNEFAENGKASELCVSAVRDTLRASRVIEDYVAEWYANYPVDDTKAPIGALNGTFPWIQFHPEHKQLDLRSGDVFISRGNALTSAAISRITDDDANFSHLAMLYIDERTGEKWVVEAHIEIGAKVAKWDDYRFDGKARTVQLRYKDPELAQRAAKLMHDKVKAATDSGTNICYDFAMDMSDRKCMFCSEIVSVAFALASDEAVQIPRFFSTIKMKNPDFVRRLGVTATRTFMPADIELDGRFEVLAEWRDLGKVNRLHEYDAILTSIFSWMDNHGYVLHDSLRTDLRARALHRARSWPVFSKVLGAKFPTNMPRTTLATIMTLDTVGTKLAERLSAANIENRSRTGFWLTPEQMLDVLERYRKEDLQRLESGRATHFHQRLRKKQRKI